MKTDTTTEPQGQSTALRCDALVVLGRASAKALIWRWQNLERKMRAEEKAYHAKGEHATACALGGTADGYEACIEDLRRRMDAATERQPQHNQ